MDKPNRYVMLEQHAQKLQMPGPLGPKRNRHVLQTLYAREIGMPAIETYPKVFNKLPKRLAFKLKDIVSESILQAGHVFLGFTKDGQFVVSYTMQIEDTYLSYSMYEYTYILHWWMFVPSQPLQKVSEVHLFGDQTISQELYLAFCEWPCETQAVVYGCSVGDGDQQCYITITAFPSLGSCSECDCLVQPASEDEHSSVADESTVPPQCLKHSFSVHTNYQIAPPYPLILPHISLKTDGMVVINTGDSLVALTVRLNEGQVTCKAMSDGLPDNKCDRDTEIDIGASCSSTSSIGEFEFAGLSDTMSEYYVHTKMTDGISRCSAGEISAEQSQPGLPTDILDEKEFLMLNVPSNVVNNSSLDSNLSGCKRLMTNPKRIETDKNQTIVKERQSALYDDAQIADTDKTTIAVFNGKVSGDDATDQTHKDIFIIRDPKNILTEENIDFHKLISSGSRTDVSGSHSSFGKVAGEAKDVRLSVDKMSESFSCGKSPKEGPTDVYKLVDLSRQQTCYESSKENISPCTQMTISRSIKDEEHGDAVGAEEFRRMVTKNPACLLTTDDQGSTSSSCTTPPRSCVYGLTMVFIESKYMKQFEGLDVEEDDTATVAQLSSLPVSVISSAGLNNILSVPTSISNKVNFSHIEIKQQILDMEQFVHHVAHQLCSNAGKRYLAIDYYDLQLVDVVAESNDVVGIVLMLLQAAKPNNGQVKSHRSDSSSGRKVYQTGFSFVWKISEGTYQVMFTWDLKEENKLPNNTWNPGRQLALDAQMKWGIPQAYMKSINVLTNAPMFRGVSKKFILGPYHNFALVL